MHFDDVQDAYDYLYGTFNYERLKRKSRYVVGQTFDLSRIRELDDRLGRPSAAVPVVHVAGTKGKGSTCYMLESVLREAGCRVGMFTSPHLVDIEERIRLDGANIEPSQFARLVERVSEPAEAMRTRGEQDMPTFFELVTACAFLHFAETRPDVAIVEVGLGGRLDSTNVVTPEVSVIAEIGIDHQLELGDSIAQIASEKGGIIKPGLPVVTSAVNPVALEVFHNRAAELGSPLTVSWQQLHAREVTFRGQQTSMVIDEMDLPVTMPLVGHHQVRNALCCAAVVGRLNEAGTVSVTPEQLARGLSSVPLKGRFTMLPETDRHPTVVLDVAHNVLSVATLLETWREVMDGRPFVLLFGASAEKDIRGMLELLKPHASATVVTRAWSPRGAQPGELVSAARLLEMPVEAMDNTDLAWPRAVELARLHGCPILVTGTFYLVGEVLRILRDGRANPVLDRRTGRL